MSIYCKEKEMATHSSILAWKSPWKRSLVGYSTQGHKEPDIFEATQYAHIYCARQGIYTISYNDYGWNITLKIMNHYIVHL